MRSSEQFGSVDFVKFLKDRTRESLYTEKLLGYYLKKGIESIDKAKKYFLLLILMRVIDIFLFLIFIFYLNFLLDISYELVLMMKNDNNLKLSNAI